MNFLEKVEKQLIVSCQALEDEPLYSSFIMSKMALAAKVGGAAGLRANTVADIQAIKQEADLPIIGIIKQNYGENGVFITPTMKEVEALYQEGLDVIAFDGTQRERPDGKSFSQFFSEVRANFPDQLFMADISTVDEGIKAAEARADIVATTLAGYTPYSQHVKPLDLVQELVTKVDVPVIAEGNFDTPDKARKALELGAHAVVVGSAVTRPQCITETFTNAINQQK